MIKYLIFPGYMKSVNDGEMHYISASQLINLYDIPPRECAVIRSEEEQMWINQRRLAESPDVKDLMILRPQYTIIQYKKIRDLIREERNKA